MTAWLLTWLWQGAALTLAVRVAFRALPRLNAATRYAIWLSALGLLGVAGAMPSGAWYVSGFPPSASLRRVAPEIVDASLFLVPSVPEAFFAVLIGGWAAIALVKLVRLLPGLHAVNALRGRCQAFPPDIEAQLPLWLEAHARGRNTRLMVCNAVPSASVLGFVNVTIVVPPSLLAALTRDELDQVILHERAHVQRWDDWTRLVQEILHAAVWIHPAALFIVRQLDLEREIACDEWVVARTGQPKAYARCLARAAEVRGQNVASAVMGPALFHRKGDLRRRVERLLAITGRTRPKMSALAAFSGACALLVLTAQLRTVPLVGELGDIVLPEVPPAFASDDAPAGRPFASDDAPAGRPFASDDAPAGRPIASDDAPAGRPFASDDAPAGRPIASAGAAPLDAAQGAASARREAGGEPAKRDTLDTLETLSARSFEASYSTPVVVTTPPAGTSSPWRKASVAGVRLADTFARAGVSLARRF